MQHFLEDGLAGKVPMPFRRLNSATLDFLFVGFLKNGVYMVKIRNMDSKEERFFEAIEQIWCSLHGKKWHIDWTEAGPIKMHVWNVTTVRPKLFGLLFNYAIFNFFNVSHHSCNRTN
jgi:hypothetical protein